MLDGRDDNEKATKCNGQRAAMRSFRGNDPRARRVLDGPNWMQTGVNCDRCSRQITTRTVAS